MNKGLTIKLGTIGVLMLLLLIPLQLISGLIEERQAHRNEVLEDIARSSSYSQKITGPLLVVPYRKIIHGWKLNATTGGNYQVDTEIHSALYFLPEDFIFNGKMQTEIRKRGIYEARLFHADDLISGLYDVPANWGIVDDLADYQFGQPYLSIGISDIRGIENGLKLNVDGYTANFQPGSKVEFLGDGVHASLVLATDDQPRILKFSFALKLQGTNSLTISPIGRESAVSLSSDWPSPSFIGNYLPNNRTVNTTGFNAHWQTSFFSTNLQEALQTCVEDKKCEGFSGKTLGVGLIDPVDQYLKSDRSIKYALLFVALTFAGFFLFEILKKLAVHAIQYGLIGLSLAVFYLLLLSLSEQIGFALAYGVSALACVSLIGVYVSGVLKSWFRGFGFFTGMALLYGLLFVLISAEDYALLMGSLFVFGLLGAVMVLTRKVNWFDLVAIPR